MKRLTGWKRRHSHHLNIVFVIIIFFPLATEAFGDIDENRQQDEQRDHKDHEEPEVLFHDSDGRGLILYNTN